MTTPFRILGIDPGFGRIGFAIIENNTTTHQLIDYGSITTDAHLAFEQRLACIYEDIVSIIKQHRPSHAVIESLFFDKNITTGIRVAESRGVLQLACVHNNITIDSINPSTLKNIISGYGKADKKQIASMIRLQFSLQESRILDDTMDAISCAYAGSLQHSSLVL